MTAIQEKEIKLLTSPITGRYSSKRFAAAFGVPIHKIPVVFYLLKGSYTKAKVIHLLWTLHFLKTYPTEILGSAAWRTDTKTWAKYIRQTIEQLLVVLPDYDWEGRFDDCILENCCSVIDVTRVQVQKPKVNQGLFYSAKDKFHPLKFEVVVTIANPRIIWVNGGFPGSKSDITIAREDLLTNLAEGERVLGDLGYRGRENALWTPFLNPRFDQETGMNVEHSRIRQVVERMNQRLKIFDCLKSVWRHEHLFLQQCFNVIAKLTNLVLISQPL